MLCRGVDFLHCNRVHPLMQARMQEILHILVQDDNIKKIVLYGSPIEFRCSSYSDIDLYIEKNDPNLPLKKEPVVDCEIDLVMDLEHDSRLYQSIDQKGLLLYDREQADLMR